MTLRTRTVMLVTCLLVITILATATVVAVSARQSILTQATRNGQIIAEQFAHAAGMGERVRQQFMDELLSENVSAIWVVDLNLATLAHKDVPDSGLGPTLSGDDRAALQVAMAQKQTQTYYDGEFLKVARHITGEQGQVTGAALIAYPTGRVQEALNRQMQLTALVAAVSIGLGVLASIWVAQTLSRHLTRLMKAAQAMEAGQLTLEQAGELLAKRGKDEISRLSRILGQMAQEVILRYQEVEQRNKELQTVHQIAQTIGGSLDPDATLLFQEFKQRNTELQTVYQMAQALTASSIDPSEALQTILERVQQVIPYDGGEICLYVPEENGLQVRAWKGEPGYDSRGRIYRMGEGFTGWIGEQRRTLMVPDIEQHPSIKAVHRQMGEKSFVRSFMGVPLIVGDRLVGTLELVAAQPGMFDRHMQRLLETIAPQAAIAIETAHRVEERERRLREQIAQLRIEVDEAKKARQVAEITETDYFQELQTKAKELRRKAGSQDARQ